MQKVVGGGVAYSKKQNSAGFLTGAVEKGSRNLAGWVSSHTTPFGAAVPARPPTRYRQFTGGRCFDQWAEGLKICGTRVLVLATWCFLTFPESVGYGPKNARGY